MKTRIFTFMACALSAMSCIAQINVRVDDAGKTTPVSDMLYGIFFEDINHAADGGLYAELISNRSFEDAADATPTWSTYASPGATLTTKVINKDLLNDKQHQALEMTIDATPNAPVCLVNEGFWGINAVQGRTYQLSFWAKGKFKGHLKACLSDGQGEKVYAETPLDVQLTKKWIRYTATLKANDNDPKAQFVLVMDGKGTICLDVVSLFPPTFKGRENGCRPDLAWMLYNLKPKFMRFPGGCFVEGQESPDNAFRWDRTIGPIEEREGHRNVNWGYRTTDGLGFHEYLQLAEDLGAKPLFVVNVGIWHGGVTPVDELQPWIDECLNALEYANGDVTTKYGAMRARNGHPEPFNIEYLEIGNENNQPDPRQQSDRYYDRFKLFKDAVLAKYPNMHLIGNVVAWGDDNPKWESRESVELVDEHYYRSPGWFSDNYHKYDSYPRGGAKVYCGEYAVTQGFGKLGSLNAALGEAVFMMGMENNGDVVEMASYAPIFVNENNVSWQPDMIRFNSSRAMGTPSYYVQRLMAENVGTKSLPVAVDNPYPYSARVNITPKSSRFGYATWATQSSFQLKDVTVNGKPLTEAGKGGNALGGDWSKDGGVISQKGQGEALIFLDGSMVEGNRYELNLKARKDGGREGFIIVFNYQDENNYCWLNIGGWGNSQHAIEQVIYGDKLQTTIKRGHVETGRWYDVRVQVDEENVKCWLDDELLFDTRLRVNSAYGFFANAQMDDNTGEMIVKVANTGDQHSMVHLDLGNFNAKDGRLIRLSSASGADENSLDAPTNVFPVEERIDVEGNGIDVEIPAFSLNIFRLKK